MSQPNKVEYRITVYYQDTVIVIYLLVFGTLYPAYASYKAVRSRDVREYVKWMMYWIVFALFTCGETITDVFLSFWFPFYYEIKIGFVLWLLSPATKGSSILYRKFVHPMLTNREQEIDEYIARAKEQGYHTVLHLGSRGVNYATNVIMQTAIKSVEVAYKGGGGLVNQLRKSYSLSDLTDGEGEPVRDVNRNGKDVDGLEYRGNRRPDRVDGPRSSNRARGYSPRRSASGSARMEMYFPEVDVDVRQRRGSSRSRETSVPLSHIRSSEDVSSGYTSGDHFYEDAVQMDVDQVTEDPASLPVVEGPLVRTASVGSTRSTRAKGSTSVRGGATSTAAKKATQGEHVDGSSSEEEDLWSDPLDHVSPLLDRTLFVNDLNTFPMHQPKLAVEFISSSAELSQTPSTGVEVVNENLSSIFIDNQPNVDDEKVTKLVPIEIQTSLSELSNSKSSHGLNDDPEAMNVDALKNPSLVAREDIKSDLSSPSDCLMLENGNQELTSESSLELVSEEKNIVNDIKKSSTVSAEESPGSEIPSTSQDIISKSIVTAADDSIAENKEPSCMVSSSINAAGLVSKLTSEETTVLTTDCNEPSVSSESTLVLATVTPVIIEQTEHKVLKDAAKVASASVTPVIIEHTEHLVMENTSNTSASVLKENLAAGPRGGKYNKHPAPEPPQHNDKSRGSSAEPDFKGQDAVHARLVLQRGIVRSLPDVGLASSDDPLVRSEVFVAVNAPKHSSLSPSSHANLLPKPNGADRFVGEILSKSPVVKENAGVGFPQFLNLPGRPHFGSLTSLFPFWHGGTSTESSSVVSHKKIGENIANNEKMPTGIVECKEVKGCSESSKKVDSENKPKVPSRASRAGKSDAAERGRDEAKKHFPVRQLSHSPSRANRRF